MGAVAKFVDTGTASMAEFFEFVRRGLTRLAAHKFFNLLSGVGGALGGGFKILSGLFGSTGLTAQKFQAGGIPTMVGGQGTGDHIPAMLSAGEMVLPRKLTDQLLLNGGLGGGGGRELHFHFANSSPLLTAEGLVDAARMVDEILDERARSF